MPQQLLEVRYDNVHKLLKLPSLRAELTFRSGINKAQFIKILPVVHLALQKGKSVVALALAVSTVHTVFLNTNFMCQFRVKPRTKTLLFKVILNFSYVATNRKLYYDEYF